LNYVQNDLKLNTSGSIFVSFFYDITRMNAAFIYAKFMMKDSSNKNSLGTPPYTVDITSALKQGENKLQIKVVNTWVNRLVGDSMLPKNQRPTSVIYGPDPNQGLESSGLLGPVKIDIINY